MFVSFRVDKNEDTLLNVKELSEYINLETQNHINQGIKENYGLFISIDRDPQNGKHIYLLSFLEIHDNFKIVL